ncbi:hypothetical protein KF840_06185 [bacterium]|nr:hypothetical protein [bacterium]
MSSLPRAVVALALLLLGAPPAGAAAGPAPTPRFSGEGAFTLDCHGTTTADGQVTADTRRYDVDTRRCTVAPWSAARCKCIDETIACDNRNAGRREGLVINRLTTKVMEYRAGWRFEGRCKRRAP